MRIGVQVSLVAVGVLFTGCSDRIDGTTHNRTESDLITFAVFLREFRRVTGRYPSTDEGLHALIERKLMDVVPNDPWGRPYHYAASSTNERGYDLYSLGPKPETASDDIHLPKDFPLQ